MGITILGRHFGTTNVGASPLKCPHCNSTRIKLIDRDGPYDNYLCRNPKGRTNLKTGEFRECATRFRYMPQSMDAGVTQNMMRANPGIALGTDPRYQKTTRWRKVPIISPKPTP